MKHLLESAYSEEEDAFYDRALANYPDHSERRKVVSVVQAGPVRTRNNPNAPVREKRAYTDKELRDIEQQGRDRPRPLTHEQTELASHNRGQARGNLAAMERWFRSEVKEPIKSKRRLERVRGGPVDETLQGIEMGNAFWQPIEW